MTLEGRSIGPINGWVQSTLVEQGTSCSLSKVPNIVGFGSFTVGHVATELLHDQASNFTLRSQETTLYLVLSIIFLLFSLSIQAASQKQPQQAPSASLSSRQLF